MDNLTKARLNTYNFLHSYQEVCLCPKCKEYIILDGYVCFGCGYDKSDDKKDNHFNP